MRRLCLVALGCVVAASAAVALSGAAFAEDADGAVAPASATDLRVAAADAPVPPPPGKILRTRFIVGLEHRCDYEVFSLSNPNRVVVELPDVSVQLPSIDASHPIGLVKNVRAGLAAPGKSRIVIDVTQPAVIASTKISEGPNGTVRLAVDILPATGSEAGVRKAGFAPPSGLGAGDLQPPMPRAAASPKVRDARTFKPIIVLDPGHGGHDSGAEKHGTVEKDVVLAFGLALRELLEKTGRYKIMMTRNDDTFIPLDERTAYAERNGASLFIAIHADYSDEGSRARGATIYSLRDGVAKSLERSAKGRGARNVLTEDEIHTVKSVSGDIDAVKNILSDLADRDVEATHERTGMFAKTVIENMGESTPLRTEPEQQAAFRVLKTAQFPSVLIELAYVTNQQDADNLKSLEWREKVAQSIVTAIDNYFSHDIARMPM